MDSLSFDSIGYTRVEDRVDELNGALSLEQGKRRLVVQNETHFRQIRYLGLDIGSRRIGVAVSDELGLTAQPVLTLERRRIGSSIAREDLRSLARLARRYGVAAIVVGNPVHLSGDQSPQAARVQGFAAELGTLTGLPIHLWDERLTSREAHQILYEAGRVRQQHREVVDQVAAMLILQSFLDERQQTNR